MKALSVSVVKSTTKTNIDHNNRQMTRNELRTNQHINLDRSSSNVYLVKEDIKELYEREFGQALENYNNKQKRNDRKIENYYDHISDSKKTTTQQEMIFQIGTAEDFENGFDRDIAVEILEKSFEDFKERNPQLKIYNAVIHNDEATPHLHINFVPVAEDYRRGLEKQVAFDRAIQQQNPGLDKNRPFEHWRALEIESIENVMQKHSIQRKSVGTNKIADVNHFKAIKKTERQIESLLHQLEVLKSDKQVIGKEIIEEESKLDTFKARSDKLERIASKDSDKALRYAEGLLKKAKPTIFNKEMIQIPKTDLESLENAFKSASISNESVLRDNRILKKENHELHSYNNELTREVKYLSGKLEPLERSNKFDEVLFNSIKPVLQNHHDHIQAFLNRFIFNVGAKDFLKGFMSGVLDDRNLRESKEIGHYALEYDHQEALENYGIGSTIAEHEQIKAEEQEIKQSRRFGMSR